MTVVFFCPLILRDYFRELFDIEGLLEKGYQPIFLDATGFYDRKATATDDLILNKTIVCSTEADFRKFKATLPEEPVLYLIFDLQMKMATKPLDFVLRKQDKIISYYTKSFAKIDHEKSGLKKMGDSLIKSLGSFLPLHYFKFYYKNKHSKYLPDYYLCSTNYLMPSKFYLTIPRNKRFVVHADDINKLIGLPEANNSEMRKTGVFLDQGIPFLRNTHPKLYTKPFPEGYFEEYYKKVTETLSVMKKRLELDEMMVALHPDAVKFEKELDGKFKGFKTFSGNTAELIRNADFVFGHNSTALSYAIFLKRPVVILTDYFLKDYHPRIRESIEFFIEELGMKEVSMDETIELKKKEITVDLKKYDNYSRKFLKDNEIWENSYHYAIKYVKEDLKV